MPAATRLRLCAPVIHAAMETGIDSGAKITSRIPTIPSTSEVVASPFGCEDLAAGRKTGRSRGASRVATMSRWGSGSGSGSGGAGSNCGAGRDPGADGGSQPPAVGSSAINPNCDKCRGSGGGSELRLDPVHHRAQLLALALDL